MKAIMGLGNPGPKYDATRHNVGWWVLDRLAYDWNFGTFEKAGPALVSEGVAAGVRVRLMKPMTYMNRSGAALAALGEKPGFDFERDLLVVVDDAAMEVGRIRFRPSGSAGGHNGLKSIAAVLGGNDFQRLRIGVGKKPSGVELADWVLSEMSEGDEQVVVDLLPGITEAMEVWLDEGIEAAMNRFNR
ncbi:MAG: aminoacyl-tRNA hydrolase [Gemmatimonadota bacterium]